MHYTKMTPTQQSMYDYCSREYRGKCYTTNTEVVGVDIDCTEVRMPEGSLVEVIDVTPHSDAREDLRMCVRLLTPTGAPDANFTSYDGAFLEMLDPAPGVPRWLAEDRGNAQAQGWDVFHRDVKEDEGWEYFELQQVDEVGRFKTDDEAHAFVWRQAVEFENPTACHALAFLAARAPGEYAKVRKTGLTAKE